MSSYPLGTLANNLSGSIRQKVFSMAAVVAVFATAAIHASAARVNFAKYQAVTASGQSSTYSPDFAVDGIVSNFHSFRTNNTTNPQWLEVRFPRPVMIGSAHLYLGLDNDPAQGGLPGFKFQYHDGANWVDVPGSTITGNTSAERAVIFSSAVTSDRFRLYTDENNSRTIRELAMFPPNLVAGVEQGFPIGTDVRLSLGYKRPTAASAIQPGAYPKRAVDGFVDDASRWLSPATAAGDTLEIDLLATHVVGSAHLYSGFGTIPVNNPAENFVLDYWDNTAWQPIPGAALATNTNASLVIPFTTPVTTSKIRYRTTTANFARVRELLLFPPRAGGYPLGQDVETSAPPAVDWETYSDSSYKLRCGITDGRFLGFYDDAVRFSSGTLARDILGWQLLLNHRDGSYRIRHQATGKCLAPTQMAAVDHDPVILEDYSGMPHQDWFVQAIDATYFRIVNAYTGMALQTRYGNWTAGNPMAVRPVDGSNLQRWYTQDPIHHPKKGIAASHNSSSLFPNSTQTWLEKSWQSLNGSQTSWSYSWGRQTSGTFPFMPASHTFNPMQWSGAFDHGASPGPIDYLRRDVNSSPKPVHIMGYNEPDRTDQANMTVGTAIARWPRLEALDAPLVAPCPASPTDVWAQDFFTAANNLGLRRDHTPVHWYASPNAGSLISYLQNVFNTFNRPIWLTEFSVVSWDGGGNWTRGDNFNFLAEFMWRAESLPWLKRYSLFQYMEGGSGGTDNANAPRSNTYNADGTLTAFGQLYAGWDGVTSVINQRVYHLHNRSTYRRVQNPASTDLVASVSPDTPTVGTQWFLVPGTTANTVRVASSRDGRLLRFYTGVSVGLAPATTVTPQVEWRLVADQDGWYFLEHPQTTQRLRINGSGTLVMGALSSAGDDYKWRFVAPAVVDNVAPVLAAIPPQTVNEGVLLTFTASATDADLPSNILTYSLVGAPSGASIDSGTGVFTWTPTQAQSPGTFNFTVRVSDGSLTHDQPVTVTVVKDGAVDILETWIVAGQSNAEGYGITESPVPGLAPSSTLASIGRGNLNVTHNSIRMFQGANESNDIPASAGLSLPARNTWHAMTAYEGLAYDWGSGRGNESGRRFGPELAFGYDVQRRLGSSIALIKYARGSTSIAPSTAQSGGVWRDYDPSDGGRLNQYDKLVATIQAAVNSLPSGQVLKVRGVVWMQGESDATATNAPAYQANLTEFVSTLRADIGTIAAASGGKMTRSAASWSELDVFVGTVRNTNTYRQTVINAQNAVAAADANVFTVDGYNGLSVMTTDDWGDTGVHYDTAGQVLLGERFADAAISRLIPSPEVDTDGDGLSDLLEYAFVTHPGIPNGNPFHVLGANTGTTTLEFPWNWQAAGLSWRIRHGHDLSNIATWPVVAPGTTTTTREGNIDRITVTPAMAYPDRGFYVLEVIGN